ncbi:TetR/AcrR family transcriptional regulator [Acuticoccus sediminis]|uniref:TetR/AcrR family transcriptional regulator n=1 Tax=Acuticoccus sediminis TaxID=2184697 RepID=UPI001CFF04DE|nr:TetR/AcrR family transcriptional regulator [Acuticoccus sediminis]
MVQKRAPKSASQPRRFVAVASQEPVIVDTAAELFLARGYDGVSIDAITAIVGGSKRDIYTLFGDKETLFRRAVEKLATERSDLVREVALSGDLRASLTTVGLRILDVLLSPRTLALHKLMISEAGRIPDVAETFLQNAPNISYSIVENLLNHHAKLGEVRLVEAALSARIFVSALISDLQLRALLGKTVSSSEQRAKAEAVVKHFLDGIGSNATRADH